MKDRLTTAIAEAERFLIKAKEARDSYRMVPMSLDNERWIGEIYDRVALAAAKRASLDLTHALVPLRKTDV